MQITLFDHIAGAYYGDLRMDDSIVEQIVEHTEETWQPDRRDEERGSNTRQGKVAEEIVEQFFLQFLEDKIAMKSYDDIRNDDFAKHAPFDFLIWKKGTVDIKPIVASIQRDIDNTPNKFIHLSEYTRRLCKDANVKIAEVKSTQIREDLKRNSGFSGNYEDGNEVRKLINEIKSKDDIFCYPYFTRSVSSRDYSMEDYCQLAKQQENSLNPFTGEKLRKMVLELEVIHQCCDVFIRVYLDLMAKRGFIIGWLGKEHLLDYEVRLKRMPKRGKSENALYFTKKLSEVEGIDTLPELFEDGLAVYASPYTTTNFYHCKTDCKYIRNVKWEELKVFTSEEQARQDGRYTKRCLNCFDNRGDYDGES